MAWRWPRSSQIAVKKRARKRFILFISNEDMDDIIKIVKLLEDSEVLIDGVTEAVKHETKKQEVDFLLLY